MVAAWWCLKRFAATVVLVVFKLWWLAGPVAVLAGLWGLDPNGGVESGGGLGPFDQFADDDFEAMADQLERAVEVARQRMAQLRGHTRRHTPTGVEPQRRLAPHAHTAIRGTPGR